MQTIETYLAQKWKETVRYTPQDEGMLIGLPYPYTVPCADGMFNQIYYWDTYFTNKGKGHSAGLYPVGYFTSRHQKSRDDKTSGP